MIKIWGRYTSTCTQRVLWTCHEIGADFELTLASATMGPKGHVSRGGPAYGVVDTSEYRALNPNGTIPTIDDDGFVLWESNTIVRYLSRKYDSSLFGYDEELYARAGQWMDWLPNVESPIGTLVDECVRLAPELRRPGAVQEACRRMEKPLTIMENQLADRPFLTGKTLSMADLALGPTLARWFLLDIPRPRTPSVEAWVQRLHERPGFQTYVANPEYHLK